VQYLELTSLANPSAGFYLKNTKAFFDNTSPLILNSTFSMPNLTAIPLQIYVSEQAAQSAVLLPLPGASTAVVVENVVLSGRVAPNVVTPEPTKLAGAGAIGLNQECKWGVHDAFAHGCGGPCFSTIEGGLCNPEIVLVNVSLGGVTTFDPVGNPTSWLKFGVRNGNPYTGVFTAFDDSLCGGDASGVCQGKFRAVASRFMPYLLKLPGSPCAAASSYGAQWHQRYDGGVVCTVPLRRFDVWSLDQSGKRLMLLPPGCSKQDGVDDKCGVKSYWLATGDLGTKMALADWTRFAQGYPFVVVSYEALAGEWTLLREDGSHVDAGLVTAVEFSDIIFSKRFGHAESFRVNVPGTGACVALNTDPRTFITAYGPVTGGGGACPSLWGGDPEPR